MDRSIWFGGVEALIRSKFRLLLACTFLALLATCFLGGVLHLDSVRLSKLDDIVVGWCLGSLVVAPFLMGAYTTLSPVQGRFGSRRLELLTLPLGRWAIPISILVSSFIAVVLFWTAGFIGFGIAYDPFTVSANFLFARGFRGIDAVNAYALTTFLFFYTVCFVSTGAHTASFCSLWVVAPLVVLSLTNTMGFTHYATDVFELLLLSVGIVYYAVLPFILYARPRFYWTTGAAKWGLHMYDVAIQFGALSAISCYALFGFGSTFFFFTIVTILVTAFAIWQRDPNSRPIIGHARIGNILALALLFGLTIFGVCADQQLLNAATPAENMVVRDLSPSPNKRYMLVTGCPRTESPSLTRHPFEVRRAYLIDLKGEEAPVPFQARQAAIDTFSWSKDGRFVVVMESSLGRINGAPGLINHSGSSRTEAMFLYAMKNWNPTEIYDTQSRTFLPLSRPPFLAEGWEHPDELVRSKVTPTGEVVFYSAEQGQYTLPKSHKTFSVLRYIDGLAYLFRAHSPKVYVFKNGQIEALPNKIWKGTTITDKTEAKEQLNNPHFWSHEIYYDEKDPRKVTRIEFLNGDQKMEFSATRTWILYSSKGFYIIDKDGVCFIDVKKRSKELVLKHSGKEPVIIEYNDLYYRNLCFYFDDGRIGRLNTVTNEIIEISSTDANAIAPRLLIDNNELIYTDEKHDWYYRKGSSHAKLFELGVKTD